MPEIGQKKIEHTTEDITRLALEGDLTIQRAGELKSALESSLETNEHVEIAFGQVDAVDVSFLQILCSAHRTAAARAKKLKVPEDAPEIFKQAVREAGLARHMGCYSDPHQECLWKES